MDNVLPGFPNDAHLATLGNDVASLRRDFLQKLAFELMKFEGLATPNDHYLALSYTLRDRLLERWMQSARTYMESGHRTVIYLSAEYLLGPQLGNALLNLGVESTAREAMASLGLSLDAMVEHEEDPGLGNGGLGRLAACFMDSLATLRIPAIGHGIRYEFGIFDQVIRDGWQIERTDQWLRLGFPWEVRRNEIEVTVGFGGRTEDVPDGVGGYRKRWIPERVVKGVPSDVPVLGYGVTNTNFLRLWSAAPADEFDLDAFQVGEYWRAVEEKARCENITKILYPNDSKPAGKQLRLEQEAFFVSCALQDCIRLLLLRRPIRDFAEIYRVQLNDTHPSLAVPELMRLLMDEHDLGWDEAWDITTRAVSYTNHTLMPEALETWPLPLFAQLLPRHLEIVFEINRRFLDQVRSMRPGDPDLPQRVSLIDERGEKSVRMAYLATVASHAVNGVAALHSRLLRETVLRDFAELWPERFTNVTNGVTPRRFLGLANPRLTSLVTEAIGEGWLGDLERLSELERFADDAGFRERWRAVKDANKADFAGWLRATHGLEIDPTAIVAAQVKRIHEYKRQLLAVLHLAWLQRHPDVLESSDAPRALVMAGKAAPGYARAKLIVKLAHDVGSALGRDPRIRERLRFVFVPDFNVKTGQHIYPSADLSLQISTAGLEASGTGNMKFALSGALTIGTLDGANVEIREAVGAENFFLFGLTAHEVETLRRSGWSPRSVLEADPELASILDDLAGGRFSPGEPGLFAPIVDSLRTSDPFFVLVDFRAYVDCQERAVAAWRDREAWTRASILNTARCGRFSSDRSIREYAERIWKVEPVALPRIG
ncbi:MAG: glycogen/starch/alpha-glucan phosphorylase [Alphaproteobacteria bacterium]